MFVIDEDAIFLSGEIGISWSCSTLEVGEDMNELVRAI